MQSVSSIGTLTGYEHLNRTENSPSLPSNHTINQEHSKTEYNGNENASRQQGNNRENLLTSERLKTVKIEGISLKKLDSGAAVNGRELLRDGVHRVP